MSCLPTPSVPTCRHAFQATFGQDLFMRLTRASSMSTEQGPSQRLEDVFYDRQVRERGRW